MAGDVRNFGPHHLAILVAQVIEVLIVLIMGQTNGGSAHFTDQLHIFFMMLREQGVTDAQPVLMAADTAEGIFLAVENEASVGIHLIVTAAESGGYTVKRCFITDQCGGSAVEVGILSSVPQMCILDNEAGFGVRAHSGGNRIAFCVKKRVLNLLPLLEIGYKHFYLHICVSTIHNGSNLDAGAAVEGKIKVAFRHADQIHIPVKAAVEGEVRHLGIHGIIGSIIHDDTQKAAFLQNLCEVNTPGRIAAVMLCQQFVVQVYFSGRIGTVYFREVLSCCREVFQHLSVAALATEIVTAAVLTVSSIPAVGKIDRFPIGR